MVAYPPQKSSRSGQSMRNHLPYLRVLSRREQSRCSVVFAVDRRKALGLIVNCRQLKANDRQSTREDQVMAKNGYKIIDSDMHVFEPHDLYLKYMNPKWGDRIPRGQPRKTHGQIKFTFADGKPIRPSGTQVLAATLPIQRANESSPGETEVADRYAKPLVRDYDAISQLEAMDEEGLDVAVLFRTFPLHCDDSLEAEYANDLCRAWNSWMADFCKENPQRLKPSALITLHDVDLAVDETRRAVKLGAIGLSLVPEPANGRHIHYRYYDPVWREAEKLGVAVCFHP